MLKDKVKSLEELNQLYVHSDSLQRREIIEYQRTLDFANKNLQKLKSSRKKIIIGFSAGLVVSFITGLLLAQ